MEKTRRPVVVTGFGPFGEYSVNASWIAVQLDVALYCATVKLNVILLEKNVSA